MGVSALQTISPPETGYLKKVYDFCDKRCPSAENADCDFIQRPDSGNALLFVNGMRHKAYQIQHIKDLTLSNSQANIYFVANHTNGFFNDLLRCTKLRLGGKSPASETLKDTLEALPKELKKVKIICHSEGSLIVRSALHHLSDEKFKELYPKLEIISFGAAVFFDKRYAKRVENHVSLIDPIPLILNIQKLFHYLWASLLLLKNKVERIYQPVKLGDECPLWFHMPRLNDPLIEHSLKNSTYSLPFCRTVLDLQPVRTQTGGPNP
jgi:hypothetical protein